MLSCEREKEGKKGRHKSGGTFAMCQEVLGGPLMEHKSKTKG